ncbi:polycomb group RING finger protein 1 isoform X2 [Melanerpes formicivorus]|uniref:polycomb group RING finger protein 1 isoform X2 n=1 Tax=Melanerpes formicivorus TaxID=211600 RepID=UPI00358EBB0F
MRGRKKPPRAARGARGDAQASRGRSAHVPGPAHAAGGGAKGAGRGECYGGGVRHWGVAQEEVKVKMKELNEHIVCCLCAGYFIDATTITECLHTFCKSCIVKYLQTSKYCPMCNTKIHETQPLLNLKLDRVMQDIVYKLVPGLQESEEKRIREFYQSRGLDRVTQPSSEDTVGGDPMGLPYSTFDHSRAHYFRYDEHVSLCLEKQSSSKDKSKAVLQQKYVRCSVRAQIRHLRRVLCHRLGLPLQHVQILFNNEPLPDHMTMKQLWLSRWFGKPAPLLLHYSIKDKRR